MIPSTPAIMGPGIEEEYADALVAIDDMRTALGSQRLTNDTPEGRVLLNIQCVEQEIRAQRLPIPVDDSFVGTIYYLVGSNELADYPGFQEALGRLWLVLKGYGLMKQRHVPLLISMMDDFIADALLCPNALDDQTHLLLSDMRYEADLLRQGGSWPRSRRPQDQFRLQITPALRACMQRCSGRANEIQTALFGRWRPPPARKPPLPAPVGGLPTQAPFLPPGLEAKLP
jgi:hypothetical protein